MLGDAASGVAGSFNAGDPATFAVTQLTKLAVVGSGKSAKTLGLTIRPASLPRADEGIQ